MRWRPSASTVVLALAMVASAGSSAQAARAPAGTLEVAARPGNDTSGVQVVSNGAGFAAAVWRSSESKVTSLRVSTRAPRGRWSRPVTVAKGKARSAPILTRLAVDQRATARLTWAVRQPRGYEIDLRTATKPRSGGWTRAATIGIASYSGVLESRVQADVRVAADGTATALWCRGGASDNVLDTKHPGTIYARTAGPDGRWGAPEALWTGRACAGVAIEVNRRGDALATWYDDPVEIDDAELLATRRPAGGAWGPSQLVTELVDGSVDSSTQPVLGEDGVIRLTAAEVSRDRAWTRIQYGVLAGDGTNVPESVPMPGADQTAGGWLGGGTIASSSLEIDAANTPVVVFSTAATPLPQDGLGTSALWAASRAPAGGWAVAPIDHLAEADDPMPSEERVWPSLQRDAAGRLSVTWTSAGSVKPCRLGTFRSTRAADGTWSRRMLLGEKGGNGSSFSCESGRGVATLAPPASLIWNATSRTLAVRPAPIAPKAAVTPRVRLKTRTWKAIQQTGAIEFTCRMSRPGFCRVSLVAAFRDPDLFDALEGFCRPAQASVLIERRSDRGLVRFPLAPGCYDGGPRPRRSKQTVRVPVLAVADVVGRLSGDRRLTVQIGPK